MHTTDRVRYALLTAALFAAALGCRSADEQSAPKPLAVLGSLPHFSLKERSGRTVTAMSFINRVWVANFIFTKCPDFCPTLTGRFAQLQTKLVGGSDPIQLVSITVDPVHDTPEVLREYADRAKAGDQWLFLTGNPVRVAALLRTGFKVAAADNGPADSPITHSDRFVLVDRKLQIRGYYHGQDQADVDRLARDAIALRDAPPE